MPKKQCGVALLAAGKGTRLKLPIPKALTQVMGQSLLDYALESLVEYEAQVDWEFQVGVVLGHQRESVKEYIDNSAVQNVRKGFLQTCVQEDQKGTGHALQCFFEGLPEMWDYEYTIVTCVDMPLITKEIYAELFSHMERNPCEGIAVSFETSEPKGYGRIVREDKGFRIVEEKDASSSELSIKEVNSGLYLLKTSYIKKHLKNLDAKNNAGEFYLTDLFKVDENVRALPFRDDSFFLGINDAVQLETASKTLRKKKIQKLRETGVYIEDSASTYIDWKVQIGEGSKIGPSTVIQGECNIGKNVIVEPFSIIKNSVIQDRSTILGSSYLEDCKVSVNTQVGPFARLRPGADIGEECKVGNFVEVKKATLKKGAKVSHLSYVGDAEIGENSNIGCGFITCNYDGANKHKTKIGSNTFIGSDCQMIAPVDIGSDAFIAAGSTISKDVPSGAFSIAREKQVIKEGQAKRFLKKKD